MSAQWADAWDWSRSLQLALDQSQTTLDGVTSLSRDRTLTCQFFVLDNNY